MPGTVSGAGDLAPLGANNAQEGIWGRNSLGKFPSSVKSPEACGTSRADVQEIWVQKRSDWVGDQLRKASLMEVEGAWGLKPEPGSSRHS